MSVREIIEGKRRWRAHVARVKALPQDYQFVYREIQKYLFKVGPVQLTDAAGPLSGIIAFFEEGAASGKGVLEVTGSDVAGFCDDLIKGSKTYSEVYQESVNQKSVNQKSVNQKSVNHKSVSHKGNGPTNNSKREKRGRNGSRN